MAREQEAYIAANRFGLGARPGEITAIGPDARGWLSEQVRRPQAFLIPPDGLPTRSEAAQSFQVFRDIRQEARTQPSGDAATEDAAVSLVKRELGPFPAREGVARAARSLTTPTPFAERLAWFWANHFTVAATRATTIPYVGLFEREAVRPNLAGSFANLLLAAARHPGMLLYLDQAQSVGPHSIAGQRRGAGLNENLAREVLELHTLGPQGGYTQADVTEFARALTGWTIAGPRVQRLAPNAQLGDFVFLPFLHEPGPRTVLGKRYTQEGEEQARAILLDLARYPATAQRIATQLARHFVGDAPAASAVVKLAKVFRDTEGDLPSLHRALVDLPEAWAPEPVKFKSPQEFLISGLRLVGLQSLEARPYGAGLDLLGQPLYRAPSPKGWPDDAPSWAGPDALMKRLEWAQALAERVGERTRPEDLGVAALGPLLGAKSREAVRRAESAAQGLTLLLMTPEFQRR